jgi:hypothetical protein
MKSAEEAKELLDNYLKERGREYPKLPSLGKTERLKVKLNGKIQAEAILDSAASHTFIPLELVEELGLRLGQCNGVLVGLHKAFHYHWKCMYRLTVRN